jgi:hypothetical protein
MMERKLAGRRMSSKLPELVELVTAKPLVAAGMVAKTLEVTTQAARRIALELGLRERKGGDTVLGDFLKGTEFLDRHAGAMTVRPTSWTAASLIRSAPAWS